MIQDKNDLTIYGLTPKEFNEMLDYLSARDEQNQLEGYGKSISELTEDREIALLKQWIKDYAEESPNEDFFTEEKINEIAEGGL